MPRYANLSGRSGVLAYTLGADAIEVTFVGGERYRYTRRSVGAAHLRQLIALAEAGRGLSSYISRHVHDRYAARLDRA
jgi:hypothetical protein